MSEYEDWKLKAWVFTNKHHQFWFFCPASFERFPMPLWIAASMWKRWWSIMMFDLRSFNFCPLGKNLSIFWQINWPVLIMIGFFQTIFVAHFDTSRLNYLSKLWDKNYFDFVPAAELRLVKISQLFSINTHISHHCAIVATLYCSINPFPASLRELRYEWKVTKAQSPRSTFLRML